MREVDLPILLQDLPGTGPYLRPRVHIHFRSPCQNYVIVRPCNRSTLRQAGSRLRSSSEQPVGSRMEIEEDSVGRRSIQFLAQRSFRRSRWRISSSFVDYRVQRSEILRRARKSTALHRRMGKLRVDSFTRSMRRSPFPGIIA